MSRINTIDTIFNAIDTTSLTMVSKVYIYLLLTMGFFVRDLIIISVSFFGLATMFGWIDYPVREFLKKIVLYSLVLTFFFSWAFFEKYIYLFFSQSFDKLGAIIIAATSTSWFPASINTALGEMMEQIVIATNRAYELDGWVLPYILGAVIYIGGMGLIIYAVALIAISKIGMTVMLAVAPLFIIFTLFDLTRGMFSAWLKQVFNFGFIAMLTYLVLAFFLQLIRTSIDNILALDDWGMGEVTPLAVVSFLGMLVLAQVSQMASGLASGAQLTTLGVFGAAGRSTRGAAASVGRKFAKGIKKGASNLKGRYKNRNTIKRK